MAPSFTLSLRQPEEILFCQWARKIVDGHERPDFVFYRNDFCSKYLSKLEPPTHRWIQVTKETVDKWKSERRMSVDTERR